MSGPVLRTEIVRNAPPAFDAVVVAGDNDVLASTTRSLTLSAGSNVSLATNAITGVVTISAVSGDAAAPVAPAVSKIIDGSNNVRFIVEQDDQGQQYETYRFDLHMNGGGDVRIRKVVSSLDTGTPHLRDKWAEFTTSEQTLAGYTPGPSETFWINVVQVGDTESSPDQLQEL